MMKNKKLQRKIKIVLGRHTAMMWHYLAPSKLEILQASKPKSSAYGKAMIDGKSSLISLHALMLLWS